MKYAPKRGDGLMAYVVSESSWGRTADRIEWAESLKDAKAQHGWTQMRDTSVAVRRATAEDIEADR